MQRSPLAIFSDPPFRHLCLFVSITVLIGIGFILLMTGGHFIYTLDDAYIHLALSDHLSHLHHGINAGEASAPSSSILYPFLLVPFAFFPFHNLMPFLINFVAVLASAFLLLRILQRAFGWAIRPTMLALAAFILLLGFNIIGIAFTGLEHALQIALALGVLYGLVRLADTGRVTPLLVVAIVLSPLVRFEGLGILFAAMAVLLLHREIKTALGISALVMFLLAAYAASMMAMGLPPLPSSVLSKSDVSPEVFSGRLGFSYVEGRIALLMNIRFLLGLALALFIFVRARADRGNVLARDLATYALLLFAGYAVAGKYDSYARYDVYLNLTLALTALVLWRAHILSWSRMRLYLAGFFLVAVTAPFLSRTAFVPFDAQGIYLQHYQMHRFAQDYLQAPVAVNDLGLVAYHNPNYVLDLWGLGSEIARKARASAASPEWMQQLAGQHDVAMAMIYRSWFAQGVPSEWRPVANLSLTGMPFAVGDPVVNFYLLPGTDEAALRQSLMEFSKSLPEGARLDILP